MANNDLTKTLPLRHPENTSLTRSLLLLGILVGPFYGLSGLLIMSRVPGYPLADVGFGSLMLTDMGVWQRIGVVISGLMQIGLALGFFRAIRGPLGSLIAASVAVSGTFLALTSVFLPDEIGSSSPTGLANLFFAAVGMALTAVSAVAHAFWARRAGRRWMFVVGVTLAVVIVVGSVVGTFAGNAALAGFMVWTAAISAWAWTLVAAAQTRSWVGAVSRPAAAPAEGRA